MGQVLGTVDPSKALTRPPLPTWWDEQRSIHQRARYAMLTDDGFEEILSDWMIPKVKAERFKKWGPPDTSSNAVADVTTQLTTPGLYGSRPIVRYAQGDAEAYIGPGGHLHRSRYWTLMQWVQYLTVGMGDYCVAHDVSGGRLVHRPVNPFDVWIECHPDRPDEPMRLWELRIRSLKDGSRSFYAWDQYDVGEYDLVGGAWVERRPPSFRIVEAKRVGETAPALDWTKHFVEGAGDDGLVGDAFPWRYSDGLPFLRYTLYRSIDTMRPWNHYHRRGLHKGTLNAATYWSYGGHCALAATGSLIIVGGLHPIGLDVDHQGEGQKLASVVAEPGTMLYHQIMQGAQPFVQEVGPGSNLDDVMKWAHAYELKQAVRAGLNPSDILRVSADSASGAALMISQEGKREYADRVRPLFEAADLDTLRKCAALLHIEGIGNYPETGYSISYAEIPESPAAKKERRDQLDWEEKNNFIGPIEKYKRVNPGTSDADAATAVVKAMVEKARIRALFRKALAAEGIDENGADLDAAPEPPTPPEPANIPDPAADPAANTPAEEEAP